jgi:hypothetical protein
MTLVVDRRSADRLPALAADLVGEAFPAIVAIVTTASIAAKQPLRPYRP